MQDIATAQAFAEAWLSAWNERNLERLLAFYAENIEMTSPYVAGLGLGTHGTLHGKEALRAYCLAGFKADPPLEFVLETVYLDIESLVIGYQSVGRKRAAITLVLNAEGRIQRCAAHYAVS